MKELYVGGLNEFFGLEGPNYIPDDENYEVLEQYDPYVNNPPEQRRLAREHCLRLNENQKGGNNRNAKTWMVTFNDGKVEIVKGLQPWAVENGYSISGIKNIAYGKWKRYRDIDKVESYSP